MLWFIGVWATVHIIPAIKISNLANSWKNIRFLEENRIVLAGNLHVFFDSKLEARGGKP